MKIPFDPDVAFARLEEAVAPFPKAALFELHEDGFTSAFEQLVACIISIRTYDETMLPIARRVFQQARTATEMSRLSVEEIDVLITPSTFHEAKAQQIQTIARRVVEEFGGALPCEREALLSLRGVGPKCANLVLGIACGQARIGVDIHVHRVSNRCTREMNTKTPEQTLKRLEQWLPQKYWLDVNRLLVPFGKHICTGTLPKCSTCPILEMCQQVGVTKHR